MLGQFNLGFILARLGRDVFIIDQHASDERYNLERLIAGTSFGRQPLLQPRDLQLSVLDELLVRIDDLVVLLSVAFCLCTHAAGASSSACWTNCWCTVAIITVASRLFLQKAVQGAAAWLSLPQPRITSRMRFLHLRLRSVQSAAATKVSSLAKQLKQCEPAPYTRPVAVHSTASVPA